MPVLYLRDENGNFVPIRAIRGANGKSAYEQAKEGGYTGTEAEFIALLGRLSAYEINALSADDDALAEMLDNLNAHIADTNNPHNVMARQTGAVPEVYTASDDLNTEMLQGGNKMTVCNYHSGTLNSPYKEGLTVFAHGMVITNAHNSQYGTQLCLPSGSSEMFVRSLSGNGISQWLKVIDTEWRNNMYHELYNNVKPAIVKIATGSYQGTNTYGVSKPNTLTFDFVPKLVIVSQRGERNATGGGCFIWISEGSTLSFINNGSNYWAHPTLNDKTLSWYCAESASYQLNSSNYTYDYFAWG